MHAAHHSQSSAPCEHWLNYFNDSQEDFTSSLQADWKRPPRHPQITWLKAVLDDLKWNNHIVTEAINADQNSGMEKIMIFSKKSKISKKIKNIGYFRYISDFFDIYPMHV